MAVESRERVQQKMRTRRDIVSAAKDILLRGLVPTIPFVADEAGVSRGTVYRFFPTQQKLLAETLMSVTVSVEELRKRFERSADPNDVEQRISIVCQTVYEAIQKDEAAFRAFLRYSLEDSDISSAERRVAGRFLWIDAALEPLAVKILPDRLALLRTQLASLLGIEPFIVYRDVCRLSCTTAISVATETAITLLRSAAAQKHLHA